MVTLLTLLNVWSEMSLTTTAAVWRKKVESSVTAGDIPLEQQQDEAVLPLSPSSSSPPGNPKHRQSAISELVFAYLKFYIKHSVVHE